MPIPNHSRSGGGRSEDGSCSGNRLSWCSLRSRRGDVHTRAQRSGSFFPRPSGSLPPPPQTPPRHTSMWAGLIYRPRLLVLRLVCLLMSMLLVKAVNSEYGNSIQTLINQDMSNVYKTVIS